MFKLPWLSALLLILACVAFSAWLTRQGSDLSGWYSAIAYTIVQAACLSIGWKPVRRLFLLGFKSDVGYSIMALFSASLAVVIVVWIQTVSYFLVMLAAALLLRVDLLTRDIGNLLSFMVLTLISWLGLGLGWFVMMSMAEKPVLQGLWTL
ncbi:MAG: hypothetical protein AAFR42_03305 [Cyanobacteria bacterium J06628_6]